MKKKQGIVSILTVLILIVISAGVGFGAYYLSQKIKSQAIKTSQEKSAGPIKEFEPFVPEAPQDKEPDLDKPISSPIKETSLFSPSLVTPNPSSLPDLQVNFNQSGVTLDWDAVAERHTNNWRLLWDEPGALALTVNLEFNQQSQCDLGQGYQVCDQSKLVNGEMAQIEGNRTGDKVVVIKLKKL